MKDSKEKEHRISNLKDMINNVKEEDEIDDYGDIEEDNELIEYLNEDSDSDFEKLEIDDEFIYHPGDENESAINLEENLINEDFIIQPPKIEDSDEENIADEYNEDFVGEISENFDNVMNAKIGGKPILAIVSGAIGVILIIISIFIFQSRSERIIDNVVAGETSFAFIIFLAIGALLLIYSLYKLLDFGNPLSNITKSIDSIENEKKDPPKPKKEEPSPKVIPKSKIPLDKDSYKVGEFNMDDLKSSLKKPTDSTKKVKEVEEKSEDIENIPPAKEKSHEKKDLTAEEIEEKEYEQAKLDSESIDDIFAEVEDMDDLEIISVDSKDKKTKEK